MFQGQVLSIQPIGNDIAELCFNNPGSVNVFNNQTVTELAAALDVLEQQSLKQPLKGLLVTSGKSVFIVGADITEFNSLFTQSKSEIIASFASNNSNLNRLASLPFPVAVAINGFALGGGLEFCLACDLLVMSNSAKIGLPETTLGLIPGWAGTVRLPRMTSLDTATQWVVSGRPQSAKAALSVGAVHATSEPEQLRETTLEHLQKAIDGDIDYQALRQSKTSAMSLSQAELESAANKGLEIIGAKAPYFPAQTTAVTLMQASALVDADSALQMEAEAFYELSQTPQARAMVGNFLNSQHLSKEAKTHAKKANVNVQAAMVLGAGIMGGGISYQSAANGIQVWMKDIEQKALDLGVSEATKILDKQLSRGRITEQHKSQVLANLNPVLDIPNLDAVDIVVESIVENEEIKSKVLADMEQRIDANKIMVSNTSTISIDRIANNLQRPENFCGMHFFNPVHAMPLVEVIRGEKTSDETIGAVVAYALAMRKQVVVVKDCPAFLINRVMFPYFAGVERLIHDGADFREIDRVMNQWGWPMGPAHLADVIGMDTMVHCTNILKKDFPDRMLHSYKTATEILFENQRLGQKNGSGFYGYGDRKAGKTFDESVTALFAEHQQSLTTFSDEEIIVRCMIPMAIEMARCLEESVVASPAEADIALQYSLGFPNFIGGICRWMDEQGIQQICDWSEQYAHLGKLYQVTDHMKAMAATGRSYY